VSTRALRYECLPPEIGTLDLTRPPRRSGRPGTRGRRRCQDHGVTRNRDVAAFDERAAGYEDGWLGRLHHEIADRTADLALASLPTPRRILDVGCGTGYLLRRLAARAPEALELVVPRVSSSVYPGATRTGR